MDDGVQRLPLVELCGDAPRGPAIGEVPDDDARTLVSERAQLRCSVAVPRVHDDVVALTLQAFRGEAAESVSGSGDEDAAHE
jgi:hypothetical protein